MICIYNAQSMGIIYIYRNWTFTYIWLDVLFSIMYIWCIVLVDLQANDKEKLWLYEIQLVLYQAVPAKFRVVVRKVYEMTIKYFTENWSVWYRKFYSVLVSTG